jgi:hypothetical protein
VGNVFWIIASTGSATMSRETVSSGSLISHGGEFYFLGGSPSIASGHSALSLGTVDYFINSEGALWTAASTSSTTMSHETGSSESVISRGDEFYLLGGILSEHSVASGDGLLSGSDIDDIINRGSAFSLVDIRLVPSGGSILFDFETVTSRSVADDEWKKRRCGVYRSGWTGDGV